MSYRIGIYLRLSSDDEDIFGFKCESNSITNQRNIINEYLLSRSEFFTAETVEFCDDGYSGSNFQRPAVKRLFDEIKTGNIQCVIVKDLSRFGRSLVQTGDYIEQIFPMLNVRFISVNDNYDSSQSENTAGTDIAFKNLMNEYYSRDISAKTKAVHAIYKSKGLIIGGIAPYGYKMEKNTFVVNPDTAKVVKRIFNLAAKNMPYKQIAKLLNNEGVLSPAGAANMSNHNNWWTASCISKIVHNEVYIGNYTCNKSIGIAPKSRIKNDKDNWLEFKNHHEPIVSEELFKEVSKRFYKAKVGQISSMPKRYALTGKIFCDHCGRPLRLRHYKQKDVDNKRLVYVCRDKILNECQWGNIGYDSIVDIVIKTFDMQMQIFVSDYEKLKAKLDLKQSAVKQERSEIKDKINSLEKNKLFLYDDYKEGLLSKDEFISKRAALSERIDFLSQRYSDLQNNCNSDEINKKAAFIDSYKKTALTSDEIINRYVKAVKVYAPDRVEVIWKFEQPF